MALESIVHKVLKGVRAPVPHVEGMHAVIGVPCAVEVDVPGVGGERLFVLPDLCGVGRLGQHLLEEVDVARVMSRVERPGGGMADDESATFPDQGFAEVHVEEVPETETGD